MPDSELVQRISLFAVIFSLCTGVLFLRQSLRTNPWFVAVVLIICSISGVSIFSLPYTKSFQTAEVEGITSANSLPAKSAAQVVNDLDRAPDRPQVVYDDPSQQKVTAAESSPAATASSADQSNPAAEPNKTPANVRVVVHPDLRTGQLQAFVIRPITVPTVEESGKPSTLQVEIHNPGECKKHEDIYVYGPSLPRPAGSGGVSNPVFLFPKQDSTITWAGGFEGIVPVCFVVDQSGNPTNIEVLHDPPEHIAGHLIERISAWRYRPAMLTQNYLDQNPQPVRILMESDFTFR